MAVVVGVGVTVGQIRTYYQTRYWAFSFEELRHPMEDRQPANQLISARVARPYIFGKQNNTYLLKAGWGGKRYLSEKARRRGLDPETMSIRQSNFNRNPIGCGPFRFREWKSDQYILLDQLIDDHLISCAGFLELLVCFFLEGGYPGNFPEKLGRTIGNGSDGLLLFAEDIIVDIHIAGEFDDKIDVVSFKKIIIIMGDV